MRILHFSKYDRKGGAAIAAIDSVRSQRALGVDARMFVGMKTGDLDFVGGPSGLGRLHSWANFAVERLPFRLARLPRHDVRSLGLAGLDAPRIAAEAGADLVVLHNVDGLVRIADLPRFACPLIWRTHDMWAMCGTEHYVADSAPYRVGAGARIPDGLSRWTFARKARAYAATRSLTVCAPSRWLRDEFAASVLFQGRTAVAIANGVDSDTFRPESRIEARRALGLPEDAPLLLFGCSGGPADPRKGFDLLVDGLCHAASDLAARGAELLVFGGELDRALLPPLPTHDLGRIDDRARLRRLYSAAQVTIVPSRLENLSLTVLESLACGTPVVAFAIGGMPDMIRHGDNGWLIPPFDTEALGRQLVAALDRADMGEACRATILEGFTHEVEGNAMIALFEDVLGGSG